jgi:threonine aldolase
VAPNRSGSRSDSTIPRLGTESVKDGQVERRVEAIAAAAPRSPGRTSERAGTVVTGEAVDSPAMRLIDVRSDTVSRPTDAMRRAMASAEVGDDVFGDDPTVIALEARAADLLGKEAGLFVSSGTQGNLVAQLAHLARGQETIAPSESHIIIDEAAGHAVIVGTSIRALRERPDGTLDPAEIADAFRDPSDPHEPITGLVTIENTHAHSMAQPLSVDYTASVAAVAHERGVPLHVDGARFFNAVVAQGVTARELAGPADSVTFCLSKGLGCPVGSVLVGSKDFIWRARRGRKLVGGGMRQVGILAAAGLVALSDGPDGMITRLADDHANARRLAEGLAELDGIESAGGIAQPAPGRLDPDRVRTNFVLFKVRGDRAAFLDGLRARGVLLVEYPHGAVRAATHHDVSAADVDTIVEATREVLHEMAGRPGTTAGVLS